MPTTAVDTYALTPEQVDFRDTIRQIVRERVAPRAAEIDAKAEYPWDLRKLFAEQDLLGLPFDEDYGGTGTGTLMLNVAVEEIARACASSALILMLQELGTLPIKLFGTEELKQRFLPKCASRRVVAGLRALRARGGLGPGRDDHARGQGRRRVGRHRHQELDHEPRDRRLLHRLRQDRPDRRALARDQRVRRRGRPPGLQRRQARAQARDQGLADRPADLRRRPDPRREPDRRGGQGHERRARHARPLAPRRRRPGRRHRPGRDRPRRRLRQRAPAVRPADRRVPGHAVQARRHGDAHRRRARAALPRVREDRPPRARRAASTRRWPSCSPPTRRWR